jgi:hypothetical protein
MHLRKKLVQPLFAAGRSAALAALLLVSSLAAAQAGTAPLAEFAPPGNILVLTGQPDGKLAEGLKEELAGLDWQAGAETLGGLVDFIRSSPYLDPETLFFFDQLASIISGDAGQEPLVPGCSALDEPLAALGEREFGAGAFSEFIATVGFAPLNPMPAGTLLFRSEPAAAAQLQQALDLGLDCLRAEEDAQVVERLQDESRFYEISFSYQMNLAVAFEQDILLVSSNPDVLRHSLRLLAGSAEPALADSSLWQVRERFEQGHASFGWSVDLAEAATLLDAYRGMLASDAAEDALVDRLVSALRTTGGLTVNLTATRDGLLTEAILDVNPAAGDPALAELLLGSGHTVSAPALVPAGALTVSSQVIDLEALTAYLQGWADSFTTAFGMPEVDLKDTLRQEFGLDIDTALLDWLGNEIHLVQKDAAFSNTTDMFFGGNQVYQLAVTSESAARTGLEQLGEFGPHFLKLLAVMDGVGSLDDLEDLPEELQPAVRETAYRGVEITRIQFGPNFDLGAALLPDTLLLGTPARALQPYIDVHLDGSGEAQAYPFAATLTEPVVLYRQDPGAELLAFIDFLSPFTQTAAFFTQTFLSVAEPFRERDNDRVWDDTPHDLQDAAITPLQPGSVSGELETGPPAGDQAWHDPTVIDYYRLEGVNDGDRVTVMLDGDFDTYLYLLDGDTGEVLKDNDDWQGDWYVSRLQFTVPGGTPLVLGVSSYWGEETGAYTLSVDLQPAAATAPEAEPPTFAALLDLFELLPEAGRIVADRMGESTTWQERDGDMLYGRSLLEFRW